MMRKLFMALLLFGLLALPGCAKKGGTGGTNASITVPPSQNIAPQAPQQNTAAHAPPAQAPSAPGENLSADEQLSRGLGMFDYTVDPLMSGSGFEGTVPK